MRCDCENVNIPNTATFLTPSPHVPEFKICQHGLILLMLCSLLKETFETGGAGKQDTCLQSTLLLGRLC